MNALQCKTTPYYSRDYSSEQYKRTRQPDTSAEGESLASLAYCAPRPFPHDVSVLSIDAWRDGDGWSWNSWATVGTFPVAWLALSTRRLLKVMREEGYLTNGSKGRVYVRDDQYNLVITERGTHCPLFAIAYGERL